MYILQPTTVEPWYLHFLILLLFILCKKVNTTYETCLACTFKSLGFWPDCCCLPADCFFLSDWTIFRFILKSTEHYLFYTASAIIEKQTVQITEVGKEQRTRNGQWAVVRDSSRFCILTKHLRKNIKLNFYCIFEQFENLSYITSCCWRR